jgi:hypothetical protein
MVQEITLDIEIAVSETAAAKVSLSCCSENNRGGECFPCLSRWLDIRIQLLKSIGGGGHCCR